jgi:hypothetical protein
MEIVETYEDYTEGITIVPAIVFNDSLLTKLKCGNLRHFTMKGIDLASEQSLMSLFRTIGALNPSASSTLRFLALQYCGLKWDDSDADISPAILSFQNLTLSLKDVQGFAPLLHRFAFRGLRALRLYRPNQVSEFFSLASSFADQYREDLHYISFDAFHCYIHPEGREEEISTMDAVRVIRFTEMRNLKELDLRASHTSSSIMQYIIREITRSPAVRLRRFSIRLDFVGTVRYPPTDLLLTNLAVAKADSLEEMNIYIARNLHEDVLRMVLPMTWGLNNVVFIRAP